MRKISRSSFSTVSLMFVLNGKLESKQTKSVIRDAFEKGFRSVIPIPYSEETMGCEYLSPEYFREYSVIVEECKRLSMELWIWDELYCPSGRAGGFVLKKNPDLRYLALERVERTKVKDMKDVILIDGNWAYRIIGATPATNVNLISPGSGRTFLEVTYEAYKRHFGEYFGNVIKGFFCDEPCNFSGVINGIFLWKNRRYKTPIPWMKDMEKVFFNRYGYDIKEFLPALFYYTGDDKVSQKVREDFARLITELLRDNFLIPIKNWCRENGVLFSGHFNNDDLMERHLLSTGDLLLQLKVFDIPGIDIICQQIMPEKESEKFSPLSYNAFPYNTNMAKFASSAARQAGIPYALSEIMATYGCGITIEDTKWVIDHHIMRGVYFFTPATSEYIWGADNLSFVAAFGFQSPQWFFFPELMNYYNGIMKLIEGKKPVVDNALWYPITSLWRAKSENTGLYFEMLMEYLLMNGEDFDIVSPNEIDKLLKKKGSFRVGAARYTRLIIPPVISLNERERNFIEKIAEKITVYAPSGLKLKNVIPYTPDLSIPYHRRFNPAGKFARRVYKDLGRKMLLLSHCDKPYIKIRKFKDRNGLTCLIFNESGTEYFKGYIKLNSDGRAILTRYKQGRFITITLPHRKDKGYYLNIAPGETVFISKSNLSGTSVSERIYSRRIKKFSGNWKVSILFEIGWNRDGYYLIEDNEKGQAEIKDIEKFVDWKDLFGRSFSGCVSYENEFLLEVPAELKLYVKSLKYAAGIYVNGRYAGSIAFKPYEIVIPEKLTVKGKNIIRIDVYNTLASISRSPETKKAIQDSGRFSNYYLYSEPFDRKRLQSGISGVRLFT